MVALRGPFFPRSARRRLARRPSATPVGRRPRPAPAAVRQEARRAFRGRPAETPDAGFRSRGAVDNGAAAQARAAAAGFRLRRRAGRVHHRRSVHPAWACHSRRDASHAARIGRGGVDGDAPGSAPSRRSARLRRASGPRAAAGRGGGRRPALAAHPRRSRGALQAARRVRGGRRRAAEGDRGGGEGLRVRGGPPRGVARRGWRSSGRERRRKEEERKGQGQTARARVFRRRRRKPREEAPRRR